MGGAKVRVRVRILAKRTRKNSHAKTHTCMCGCELNFRKTHTCVRCACGTKIEVCEVRACGPKIRRNSHFGVTTVFTTKLNASDVRI